MQPEPPPPTAPLPISASISIATKLVVINFNQALVPGALNAANWEANANVGAGDDVWVPVGAPQAVASRVQFISMTPGPSFKTNVIDFAPPPFDVVGLVGGMPAAGFLNFPLAVIP